MKWVIQNNLINQEDHDRIRDTCISHGYGWESIRVIPFSQDIPDIDHTQPTIFYGATNFINNIYNTGRWSPGVFYDPEKFTVKAYMANYGENMISHPCEFTTIGKFAASGHKPEDLFFIRPVKDLKEFSGDVVEFNKIIRWERALRYLPGCDNNPDLTVDTEIMVSSPYNISHEWRLFIVQGEVSSGSHYRSCMRLDVVGDVPDRVRHFAEDRCRQWAPAEVFVIDIGESAGNLYVIECNCFNSAGFYKSDVEKIITDISETYTNGK